jgi:hypothetical protein
MPAEKPAEETTLPTAEKVLIIGKAPSSRDVAPFEDESFEVWTLSNLVPAEQVPRWDRHFELHPIDWFRQRKAGAPGYLTWLKSVADKPIYLRALDPEISCGVQFPWRELVEHFGPYPYFNNTVSWMIAYAITQGAKTIGVFGVDMATTPEYKAQRPSCEWMIGWAQALGIEVLIPPESDLMTCSFLYGIEHDKGRMRAKWDARRKEIIQRMQNKQNQLMQAQRTVDELTATLNGLQGVMGDLEYTEQWLPMEPE